MLGDSKKIASLILGIGPSVESQDDGSDDFYDQEAHGLAKDILKAIEDKNSLALKVALKAFYATADMDSDEEA
jgi:hypothetical protein